MTATRTSIASTITNERAEIHLGVIGAGGIGRLMLTKFRNAGWQNVHVCDIPERYEELRKEFDGTGVKVHRDGHGVSRISDFIIYCVEAEHVDKVVAAYGPSTKIGAIVSGQTSVKAPEIKAFEAHLPADVHIVPCHSLHGPNVDSTGQPLVVIEHRCDKPHYELAIRILESLNSEMVHISCEEHDRITADTQAVTHLAFLSMGAAWKTQEEYPVFMKWENQAYVGGIENVKVNMALRIYGSKWHVYAGLAIMNPAAKVQIHQYERSVSALFKLMIQEKKEEFRKRVLQAAEFVFHTDERSRRQPILLSDDILDRFSLSSVPKEKRVPNSHLSLLAMVDCWYQLRINPYDHLICQTMPFRLWLGIAEYLFTTDMLNEAINAAIHHKDLRGDDMEFYNAASSWVRIIEHGSMSAYQHHFEKISAFFQHRLLDGNRVSTEMLNCLAKDMIDRRQHADAPREKLSPPERS